jgi:2-haloacid dehalogenase
VSSVDEGKSVCVFDLYGTLVDFSSLASAFSATPVPEAFVRDWRQKQLSYAFAATLMERYSDFDVLTAAAYRYAAQLHGMAHDEATTRAAMEAWSHLPAYPDALPALQAARERGLRTAILSNGTPQALAATVSALRFGEWLDAVLSVDAVRAFKPHPSVYDLVLKHFTTPPERVVFVSSNGWDATGAAEFGFQVVWCNRGGLPGETFGAPPARSVASLAALFDG